MTTDLSSAETQHAQHGRQTDDVEESPAPTFDIDTEMHSAENEDKKSQAAGPPAAGPQAAVHQAADPQASGPQGAGPQAAGPQEFQGSQQHHALSDTSAERSSSEAQHAEHDHVPPATAVVSASDRDTEPANEVQRSQAPQMNPQQQQQQGVAGSTALVCLCTC